MRAAVLREQPGWLELEDVVIASPLRREVLIRVAAAGVCHSDFHIMNGDIPWPRPVVMGHESAGTVEAIGDDVTYVGVGDRVTVCEYNCGHCRMCLTGRSHWCDARAAGQRGVDEAPRLTSISGDAISAFAQRGSFAEFMLVHEDAVVKLPDGMPFAQAALVSCAVMTGAGAVFNTAQVRPGETVAVIGCGGIGLNAVQAAAFSGAARVVAIDRVASKLELARQLGATDVVDASAVDPVEAIRDLTGGGVDHAFEAIGLRSTAEQAWQMLRRRGTATICGVLPAGQSVELDAQSLTSEKRLQGSFLGSGRYRVDMPFIMEMYLQGRYKLDELISRRVPLDAVNDSFRALETGEVARSVIEFS
jgi:S-(hydroxymethyl)glutathione dehydrogenase / alcohol dehydrogenase